jgi:hypothetical protein
VAEPQNAQPPIGILLAAPAYSDALVRAFGVPELALPLQGKSLLHRSMDVLAREGCRVVHVGLGNDAVLIKALIGDGARWGMQIEFHSLTGGQGFDQLVRRVGPLPERSYLIGDACLVPLEDRAQFAQLDAGHGVALFVQRSPHDLWSGWALLKGEALREMRLPESFRGKAPQSAGGAVAVVLSESSVIAADSLAALLKSDQKLLQAQQEPIRIGRRARIHPSASLVPPVYIGDGVRIDADATVGPYASIGSGAFVDQGTKIRHSAVLPETYVGKDLEVVESVVRGNRLASLQLQTVADIADAHLVAPMLQDSRLRRLRRWLSVIALQILLAPLYLLCRRSAAEHEAEYESLAIVLPAGIRVTGGQPVIRRVRAGLASASLSPVGHFALVFYPGLSLLGRGAMSLLGPTPRSRPEVARLPYVWAGLYEERRCGLLNDSTLAHDWSDPELGLAADALACMQQGERSEMRRALSGYLKRVFEAILPMRNAWANKRANKRASKLTSKLTITPRPDQSAPRPNKSEAS